jgi:tetratricopeptide (TPR) repeat protein
MIASDYCPDCGAANEREAARCFACGRVLSAPSALSLASSSGPLGSTASGSLAAQTLLRGRYRLLVQVGKGGFGAVYKAADTQLGHRIVAVKEMSQIGLATEELREATEAFQREALLLAGLKHPNLPSVYDQFVEAGRWYLVMEFIQGETLEDVLARRGGKLPLDEALRLAQELCVALHYLHTRQPPIIFRDLKPGNVMLTPEGQLYLIDFGIARHFKPGQSKDTIAFGSPGYAAPEQYGKAQTTPRSDVYGLGALLHHLITGSDPSTTPFRFAPLPASCPAALQRLLTRMVDLDEQKRPASMAAVGQELQRVAAQVASGQTDAKTGSPVVLPAASASALAKTKEQWRADGDAHAAAGRHVPALVAYNQAIQLDRDYTDAYLNKSVVLHKLKWYREMLATCKEAVRCDLSNAGAHLNMGLALSKLRHYEVALTAFDQALQCSPTMLSAYLNKGLVLGTLKRHKEALKVFDQAIQQVPDDSVAHMLRGDALVRLKRYDEALLAYERASHLNPNKASDYARNKRWRRAQWKAQHAFSPAYARHLSFTFALDLLLTLCLLWLPRVLPGSRLPLMGSPVWLLVVAVLPLLWSFIPRLLRLQTQQRRLAGVVMALISGVLSWLLVYTGFHAPVGIAWLVAIKELLPAFLLLFSPRSLPRWIFGWLLSSGTVFGTLLFGFAGLFMSFFVRLSNLPE